MKLYILLLFETLLFINTSESPLDRTNFNSGFNQNNQHFHQQNSRFNEVEPVIQKNHRQFKGDNENFQPSKEKKSDDSFSWGSVSNQPTKQEQPSIPVAATLELPGSQQFSNQTVIVNNVPISIGENQVAFPGNDNISLLNHFNLSTEEIACFTESKVFHSESCQELLAKGTCHEGEWLILDPQAVSKKQPKLVPVCAKRNCNSTEFFWPKDNVCYHYDEEEKICPPGNKIEVNFFGYGTCVCKELNGLYINGTCYPLHTQGPCSKGYLFVQKTSKTDCTKNVCRNSSLVLDDKDVNRHCYELGKQGPCKPNYLFQVSKQTKRPDCINSVATLTAINPPRPCVADSSNQCKPELKLENSKNYIDRIIATANSKKGNK